MQMHTRFLTKAFFTAFLLFTLFVTSLSTKVPTIQAAACTPGQEVLSSGCDCNAPLRAAYHETNNGGSQNPQMFCVNICDAGDDAFNSSGVPNCHCSMDRDLIISENGICESILPDCETGAAAIDCSCLSPRYTVTAQGSSTPYCVGACGAGQRAYSTANVPLCACGTTNVLVDDYCVVRCSPGQRARSADDTPLCACSGSVDSEGYCDRQTDDDAGGGNTGGGGGLGPTDGISNEDFDALNPLKIGTGIGGGQGSALAFNLSTPGGIISRLLDFAFPIAGMILFVMLAWGGFEMVYGASNTSKAVEAGKNRITTAIIGFILLFASYWIVQLLEVVFGIKVF